MKLIGGAQGLGFRVEPNHSVANPLVQGMNHGVDNLGITINLPDCVGHAFAACWVSRRD